MIPSCLESDIKRLAPDCDPALVYAWMLLEDFRFSEVTRAKLTREIKAGAAMVRHDREASVRLAATYGLSPA